ncbi:16S rRNA (cytidine(1402)-2'-O)-methyltransferase [Patescibacteria group bacterium]|jgi:16S rRNA (cytidine1402-2'-O)-methyltransferase|nr:16S rRNA (cytidine(1402)-2'-O)-methyltransferase [Patescibacteria group bacterium]
MATLFVVATPIGNLEDITMRALRVLRAVDLVACEDTRVSKKLLAHYEIDTPTVSFHAHSGALKFDKLLAALAEGRSVALVSDAGTPAISDPGARLVSRVRHELPDVRIESVPGPSALTAALSLAGIDRPDFLFLGFLPHKKGRQTALDEMASCERPVVCFESGHRILKTLDALAERAPERRVILARELTKVHEEVIEGTPGDVRARLTEEPVKQRGEFVVILV